MDKIRVFKGIFVFAVIGLCGMGIVAVSERGLFSQNRNETGKTGEEYETTDVSATEPYSAAATFDLEEPSVTMSPKSVRGKTLKTHREGNALWTYNKETKCLVISGKGKISVHGKDESIEDVESYYYPWDVRNKQCYRPRYANKVKKIIIKSGITCINEGAFHEYSSLRAVKISDTVTTLGEYAFWRCGALKKVTMGSNVKSIEEGAFNGCSSLTGITIGRNVEKIGDHVFHGCSSIKRLKLNRSNASFVLRAGILYDRRKTILYRCPIGKKSVKIPKSVSKIVSGAFEGCRRLETVSFSDGSQCSWIGKDVFRGCTSLRKVLLPDSVRYVGHGTFYKCKSLRCVALGRSFAGFTWLDTWEEADKSHDNPSHSVFVDGFSYGRIKTFKVSGDNPWYSSEDGVLYNKDKTILFCYPPGKKDKTVKIPDSVKVIKGRAFRCNRHIEHVVLSRSLKRIGTQAFAWSPGIKTVKITGENVVIAPLAFSCCQSLSQVDLGDSVRQILGSAFFDTKLKEIHIPPSVEKIGSDALGIWCDRQKLEGGTTRLTRRDVAGFTIYGKKGSVAQRYARKHVFDFVAE